MVQRTIAHASDCSARCVRLQAGNGFEAGCACHLARVSAEVGAAVQPEGQVLSQICVERRVAHRPQTNATNVTAVGMRRSGMCMISTSSHTTLLQALRALTAPGSHQVSE